MRPACSAKCCRYFATDPEPNAASDLVATPNPHLGAELLACASEPDCYLTDTVRRRELRLAE